MLEVVIAPTNHIRTRHGLWLSKVRREERQEEDQEERQTARRDKGTTVKKSRLKEDKT